MQATEPQPRGGLPRPVRLGGPEFRLRLVSALVLAPITLGLVWSGGWAFALLVSLVGVLIVWEWAGLMGRAGVDLLTVAAGIAVVAAVGLATAGRPAAGLGLLAAAAAVIFLVAAEPHRLGEACGVLYAGIPALALVWLRGAGHGFELVLLVLFIVWATDTGAYIVGRTIGGPKLWPAVSPNKTWSGFLGGVTLGALAAGVYAASIGSAAPVRVFLVAALLAMLSQAGDLFESALKRAHGVKDTSRLIPGHGGIMDRVDGLVAAAAAAAVYAAVAAPDAPSRALLALF